MQITVFCGNWKKSAPNIKGPVFNFPPFRRQFHRFHQSRESNPDSTRTLINVPCQLATVLVSRLWCWMKGIENRTNTGHRIYQSNKEARRRKRVFSDNARIIRFRVIKALLSVNTRYLMDDGMSNKRVIGDGWGDIWWWHI